MFGTLGKKTVCKLNLKDINVTLDIKTDSEVQRQVQMIGLAKADLQYIKYLKPFVEESIHQIVDNFYKALAVEPTLQKIIDNNSSTERLKVTLRQHILEVFEGVIDEPYLEKRIRIAEIHVHIGLKSKWYMAAFQEITRSLFDVAHECIEDREDLITMLNAISKMINFEQQLVLEAFESEEERIRQEELNLRVQMIGRVSNTSENLAAIAEETNAGFEELTAQSENMGSIARKGKEVSDLAEGIASSGKTQIKEQSANMSNIMSSVHGISNDVNRLLTITNEMEQVVEMIKKIADSTHMLSLNAQIEAAHAGDAGSGFAVVAMQVGELSNETSGSVKDVTDLIKSVKEQSDKVNDSLKGILHEATEGVESMERTTKQFEEVAEFLHQTSDQSTQIESELTDFSHVIYELGVAFEEVSTSADDLNNLTRDLDQ